jgi:hypothetical protein
MPDLAMDEHGGEPQAVSRRAFLSTGAAGISAAALVPGAPDATAQTGPQTDRPGKDAAMSFEPLKKLAIGEHALLNLLRRWRAEAEKQGHQIARIAVAFEAGPDGFWLARWPAAQGVEAHVIHASSVAVTREHRRAKTDRLDTGLLKRGFLGWLRGERGHESG